MSYPWRSRFVYGTGGDEVDWSSTLPARPWGRPTGSVGGSRISAGGVPASHVVRRDNKLVVTQRFWEEEWPDILGVIEWGQSAESLLWYPDADLEDVYTVYMDEPAPGGDFTPQRDPEYLDVLDVTMVLRKAGAVTTPWALQYWHDPMG